MTAARRIPVQLQPSPHDYVLGTGLLERLGDLAAEGLPPGPCALVTDDGVGATPHVEAAVEGLRHGGFEPEVVVVPDGEAAKTVAEAERLWNRFADAELDRSTVIVALGGGSVGDLSGFCAATWLRGVALVHVPTTVLAMADSSVGGKTAVNLSAGKNLVGAFHQPSLVVADLATLGTLPDRQLVAGMAEVVKCAVLDERASLTTLRESAPALVAREATALEEAIAAAVEIKLRHVRHDVLERGGDRALLNLGHTTAHALETHAGFGEILHGEAVAIGMVVAARIAVARELCEVDLPQTLARTLAAFGLPTEMPSDADRDEIARRTRQDKKRRGGRRMMVLPLAGGGAGVFHVRTEEFVQALR